MEFKVATKTLYSTLSGVSKVINSKNTLTILDNFLFSAEGNVLTVTASDTENTLMARLELSDVEGEGAFCVNARRLVDIAKELPDVDVVFHVNDDTKGVKIDFPGGNFDIAGIPADQYPATVEKEEGEVKEMLLPGKQVLAGIDKTFFAIGTDSLRPQMMGIYWDIKADGVTFVSTDTRKLVRYIDRTAAPGIEGSCILPQKPCVILKSLVSADQDVKITLSSKSATFATEKITFNCRFIKGNYPDYNRVIPQNNPNVITVDRITLLQAVRRVAVCADPAHSLVKLRMAPGKIEMKVDDANFSTFAHESVACDYEGSEMVIGFSATFLIEIFNTLTTDNIVIKLADPSRPGVFLPEENPENTELVIILMPMTVQEF